MRNILIKYGISIGLLFILGVPVIWHLMTLYEINKSQFWYEAPFYISAIAAVFAGISAILARASLIRTSESLELSRKTVRPFLTSDGTVKIGEINGRKYFSVVVTNIGSLPAESIEVIIDAFESDELVEIANRSNHYPKFFPSTEAIPVLSDLIMFPQERWQKTVENIDLNTNYNVELWDKLTHGLVILRFTINYSSVGRTFQTVRTLSFDRDSIERAGNNILLHGKSRSPQHIL
jgi:hypothetical protein